MPLFIRPQSLKYEAVVAIAVVVCAMLVVTAAYGWYLSDRILPRTAVGSVELGGMTREQAAVRLQEAIDAYNAQGIVISVEGSSEMVVPESIALDLNLSEAIDAAFVHGHEGNTLQMLWQRISSFWSPRHVAAPVHFDEAALRAKISEIADATGSERRDIRLQVSGTNVSLLTDTSPGRAINQTEAFEKIRDSLRELTSAPIVLGLHDDAPRADVAASQDAVGTARKMISRSLLLVYEDYQFYISRDRLGSWIQSEYDGNRLIPGLDHKAIGAYVTTVAAALNIASEPPQISTRDGRVTGFIPPKVGRSVEEDKLAEKIGEAILARTEKDRVGDTIVVPLKATRMSLEGLDAESGITELIGRATTPFTGSPKNRISNIKNGVKYLTGTMIQPGEEFSTLGVLGVIDNTTGYLPELVIKGDRTTPEFGGGLCQVSTTLFRAVMNAGLPITARQNHSYRVSYYEKDGDGKVIGPGLDATIYEPNPDFKFVNDTKTVVLIIGYVSGDKVTFELYGTNDGRTAHIDGPHTLTSTPPGEPKYIPEPSLAVGVKKQVETAHPGGSAVATYTITYADGTQKAKEFRSWYRPWPAQYLVGTGGVVATPFPVSPPLETASPTPAP